LFNVDFDFKHLVANNTVDTSLMEMKEELMARLEAKMKLK
jgi:hypothetical protein